MTLDEVIYARRSIRKYSKIKVGLDKIKEIITAGMWAPTACNKQEYRFIYLDDKELINAIYTLGAAHFIADTKQAILVLYDNRIDNIEYKDNIQSGSAVIQNMLLKATELNVGTCWVCNLPPKRNLKKLLEIPSYYDPVALITLGHFEKAPQPMKRKHTVEDIMFVNKFEVNKDMVTQKSSSKLFMKRFLRSVYIRLPKTKFLIKLAERYEKKF